MSLTDVENFARRPPHPSTPTNPNTSNQGSINAAHLTTAPPYEHQLAPGLRLVAGAGSKLRGETRIEAIAALAIAT